MSSGRPERARVGAFGDRAIRALLLAETISTTGSQMTALALPWFVLTTTGSAKQTSFVVAAEIGAYVLFGIPSGTAISRLGSRRTMLLCDALRAPAIVLIPLLHWLGVLRFGELLAVAFVLGLLSAPYGGAQKVITAELLGDDRGLVGQASALFQGANRITFVAGPPLAGVLIGFIGATSVLVVDAASFAVSFALLALFVPRPRRAVEGAAEAPPRLLDGLRYLRRDPLLAALSIGIAFGDAAFQVIFIGLSVLVIAHYGAHAQLVGLFFGAWGGGAVVGNLTAYRRLPDGAGGPLIALLLLVQSLPLVVLALPVPALAIAGALAVSGLANGIVNPTIHSLLTLRPPPAVRPNVVTAIFTASAIGAPAALLVAGPAFKSVGSRAVLGAAVAFQIAAMIFLALAAIRLVEEPPSQESEHASTAGSA